MDVTGSGQLHHFSTVSPTNNQLTQPQLAEAYRLQQLRLRQHLQSPTGTAQGLTQHLPRFTRLPLDFYQPQVGDSHDDLYTYVFEDARTPAIPPQPTYEQLLIENNQLYNVLQGIYDDTLVETAMPVVNDIPVVSGHALNPTVPTNSHQRHILRDLREASDPPIARCTRSQTNPAHDEHRG
jgi:hypothetical protein